MLSVKTCNLLCRNAGYMVSWLKVEIVYVIINEKHVSLLLRK